MNNKKNVELYQKKKYYLVKNKKKIFYWAYQI